MYKHSLQSTHYVHPWCGLLLLAEMEYSFWSECLLESVCISNLKLKMIARDNLLLEQCLGSLYYWWNVAVSCIICLNNWNQQYFHDVNEWLLWKLWCHIGDNCNFSHLKYFTDLTCLRNRCGSLTDIQSMKGMIIIRIHK